MDDESGESMEPMEEVPLIELGEAELESYSAWLTKGSRELIPETKESILEGTINMPVLALVLHYCCG